MSTAISRAAHRGRPKSSLSSGLAFLAVTFGAIFLCGPAAFGVDYVWNRTAADGPQAWNTAANWTPAGPPSGGDGNYAHIGGGGTAVIDTAGGPVATIDNVRFDDPLGGTVNQSDQLLALAGTEAQANQVQPGTIRMGVFVGGVAGYGTYNLSGTGSITAFRIVVGEDGGAANHVSTFNQGVVGDAGGTSVTTTGRIYIGGAQGSGARGGGNGVYNLNSGTLNLGNEGNPSMVIGHNKGVGVLNINGGDLENANGDVFLADNDGSTGTINQTGGVAHFDTAGGNWVFIGAGGTGKGTYNLSNGATMSTGSRLIMANGSATGTGTFNIDGAATTLTVGNDFDVDHGGVGVVNQTNGTVNVNGWLYMGESGHAGASGTYNMMGGILNANSRFLEGNGQQSAGGHGFFVQTGGVVNVGKDASIGDNGGAGTYTISGPSSGPNAVILNAGITGSNAGGANGSPGGGGINLGWNNTGIFNQNGGQVNISSASNGLQFNGNASNSGNGTYNLSGGVLTTDDIFKVPQGGTGTFNFNGGTLRATASDGVHAGIPVFMGGPNALTAANVQAGGAIIDLNSFAITISQDLSHDPALPATTADGGLTITDSTVTPGTITLSGNNTFNGPTNVVAGTLNVNSANALGGSTLNLVPANAGTVNFGTGIGTFTLGGLSGSVNYTLQDTGASPITLNVGNNNFNSSYTGVLSGSGGITKVGTGTFTITAPQTYTGPTAVKAGVLNLASTGSLAAASAVTVGGAGATGTPTIAGTGTINGSLRVNGPSGGAAGHVSPGGASIGTLNVGSLTLGNGSILDFDFGAPGTSDLIASVGALTLPTSGSVSLNLTDAGGFAAGTYKLITESSTSNFSPTRFSVDNGVLGFQESFTNPGGTEIDMIVTPSGSWSATAVNSDWANSANWVNGLIPGSTSGTSSTDTATFGTASTVLTPAPDLGRNVGSITFATASAGAYVIGTTGGNALLLTTGGTIKTASLVANTETINAPLVLEGTDGTYRFLSGSSDNTKLLNFGGGITGGAAGNTALTLTGSNTGANTISGVIGNGSATSLALVKNGVGTWVLSGNNTFTGGVLLSSGTLVIGHNNALGTGTLSGDGGTLQADSNGPYTVSNAVSILSGLTVSGSNDFTLSGQISGSGGLTKTGTSALTLTGNNTFSGGVAFNAGTLIIGNNNALGTGTLTAGGGSLLQTNNNGPYTVGNAINLSSNLTLTGGSDLTLTGPISGSGGLTKTGANTLTLAASNSFSGGLTINAGRVNAGPAVPSNTTLGAGTVTLTGTNPTLSLQGSLSSGSGLLAQFYNVAPANVGNQDPAYNGLSTMNAQLDPLKPAVTVATVVGGKSDLNFTSGGTLNPDPVVGGLIGGGNREYIFNKVGSSTALYGFPAANVGATGLDNFQVRMSGFIKITTEDDYNFTTTSDDGSVLFIDNVDAPLVANNRYQGMTLVAGTVHLTPGLHPISVGFYEGGGGLGLGVTYASSTVAGDTGGVMMAIPNTVLTYTGYSPSTQTYSNNLVVTANSTINIANSLDASMGSLTIGAVTLNVASSSATAAPYSLTFNGASTLTGNATINVANSTGGGTGRVNLRTIGDGGGGFSLTKAGPGVLSISGLGTYSGGTVISGGMVIANGPGTIGTGPVTFNNATTLRPVAVGNGGFVAAISGFNGGVDWTSQDTGNIVTPAFSGNSLTLTDSVNGQARSAFLNAPQGVKSSIKVAFTYQMTAGGGNPADGTALIFQNDSRGATALGNGGGGLGYGGITNSAAFEINVYNGNPLGTSVQTNGATGGYLPTGTVNPRGDATTGNPINVVLVYDASALTVTQTLTDTVNNNTFTSTFPLPADLATLVGGDTAFVGFSGATGGLNSTQTITNFAFSPATSSTYANNLLVNGGSQATVDVGATSAISTITMGTLTVGSGVGTTLNLSAATAPSNTAYGLSLGPATVNGNVAINIANNGTARGTLTLTGASNLAAGVTINQNSGTLQFNNTSGPATVAAGVTINVASAASMILAGTVSDLSGNGANPATPVNRAHIVNSSTQAGGGGLVVTGTNQQVGAIDGAGDTVVNAGASLTANHIVQSALVIGGTATSPATVIIAASDTSGNPMAGGSALAGSSEPMNLGGANLLAGGGSASSSPSVGGSVSGAGLGGSVASVPEPSSILLVVLGSLACLVPVIRRKARKA